MKPIAIYGAGGLGREVLMLIRQINEYDEIWKPIGFFDDGVPEGKMIDGMPVLGNIDRLNEVREELNIIIALGDPGIKKRVFQKITNPLIIFATLIHPSVLIRPYQDIKIGKGSIIGSGNILTVGISIGDNVLLNLNNTIGHDVVIRDFASVMPGCNISGEVLIEEGVYVGTGAAIINRVTIGSYSKIGAGAVVLSDIAENITAVGVPAKAVITQ